MRASKIKDPRNYEIGQYIARRRKAAGMNQTELGALVELSYQQIAKYERGEDSLRVTLFERLENIFNDLASPATQAGFAEAQAPFRIPQMTSPARDELMTIAVRLESEAKRLRELSDLI